MTIHSQIVSFLLAIGKHFLFVYNFYLFLSRYNWHETLQFHVYTGMICYLYTLWVISVQFSRSVVSNSMWPHESQHARPLCPSPTPWVYPNPCPLSQWCHPNILFSQPSWSSPSPSALNLFQHQGLFKWVISSHQVAKVVEFQLQHQSFQWIFRTDLL